MDMTVASTTALNAARQLSRPPQASAPASASASGEQAASDSVDLRSASSSSDSGIILQVKVAGAVRTYTYSTFASGQASSSTS